MDWTQDRTIFLFIRLICVFEVIVPVSILLCHQGEQTGTGCLSTAGSILFGSSTSRLCEGVKLCNAGLPADTCGDPFRRDPADKVRGTGCQDHAAVTPELIHDAKEGLEQTRMEELLRIFDHDSVHAVHLCQDDAGQDEEHRSGSIGEHGEGHRVIHVSVPDG